MAKTVLEINVSFSDAGRNNKVNVSHFANKNAGHDITLSPVAL